MRNQMRSSMSRSFTAAKCISGSDDSADRTPTAALRRRTAVLQDTPLADSQGSEVQLVARRLLLVAIVEKRGF